ncbi:MAG: OsmC family protein [Dysgonamonadaceae bacterium]
MLHEITSVWKGKNRFETELDGHKLVIDTGAEDGGDNAGPRPKKLLLVAAADCSGLDVVSLLRKMRIEVNDFRVHVTGIAREEDPKYYTEIKLIYEFTGESLPAEKLEKIVSMSFEKYCGVIALYAKAIPVSYEIKTKEA